MANLLNRCIRITIDLNQKAQELRGQELQGELNNTQVVIEGTGTGQDFSIICQISKVVGQTRPSADITIFGLSHELLDVLSHINFYPMQVIYFNKITIEAGYDFNYSTLFVGNIINAVPDYNDPNTAFNIQCLAGYYDQILQAPNYNPKGSVPVKQIIESIAAKSQEKFTVSASGIDYLTGSNPLYIGSTVQQLNQVASDYRLNIQIDSGVIYVSPLGNPLSNAPVASISSDDILLGYPTLQQDCCECRVMYTENLFFGQKIHIDSDVPLVTGDWINVGMQYTLTNKYDKFEIQMKNMKYGFLNNV